MFRRSLHRQRERNSRGQGLVEFALILPLLVLLLLMALDFGRVFFGWVALHNAARIGANFAAGNAYAWDGDPDPYESIRDRYEELVLNDLQSLNCSLPPDPVDDPSFSGFGDGDLVQVELNCSFGLLTPLAENVFGGPISMAVRTDFAIYRTYANGVPVSGGGGAPPPPPPLCGAPVASFTTVPAASGGQVNIGTGQSVTFTDTSDVGDSSCGTPTYAWDFDSVGTESTQGPHTKTFTNPGPPQFKSYTVLLTVTTSHGSDTESVVVRVKK